MDFDVRLLLSEVGTISVFYLLHLALLNNASETWNKALIPTPYTIFLIIMILIMIVQMVRYYIFGVPILIGLYYISFAIAVVFGVIIYNNLWKKFH